MFAVGVFRIIAAIARFFHSSKVNDFSGLFAGHEWGWGIFDLVIAALALFAAFSLARGGRYGRLFAYAWAVLAMINAFMIIEFVPTYAVTTIALAALVLYAMLVTGPQAESSK
jgi:hypothetical protein